MSFSSKVLLSQATTTPLVRNIFELFFKNQMDDKAAGPARRKRCGICEVHSILHVTGNYCCLIVTLSLRCVSNQIVASVLHAVTW